MIRIHNFILRVGAFGDKPQDDEETKLRHRFLIYMGILMSLGGILWGLITSVGKLYLPSIIPFSYVFLTIINFIYFHLSKNFKVVRFIQVFISLLLPFFFQWSLGGFVDSGAVMLWSTLAIVGSLTFDNAKSNIKWLALYSGLTILTGFLDNMLMPRAMTRPALTTFFFVINIVSISIIVFGLTIYLLYSREKTNIEIIKKKLEIEELLQQVEHKVKERTEELCIKNEQLNNRNTKIMLSLQYASIIQKSILPELKDFKHFFKDYFVFWQPRDIVGGDFYWFDKVGNNILIAVIDCTGHGVPGALMTMTANSVLDRLVNSIKIENPSQILKNLNIIIRRILGQTSKTTQINDGMDIGICLIKPEENILIYSGAKIPLYYYRNGELNVIKGDRQSIGYKKTDEDFEYHDHEIGLKEDMIFYLTSDGFIDQIGGEKNLPFGWNRFIKLLENNQNENLDKQCEIFKSSIKEYMTEENPQVDDITIIGFKV